MAERIGKTGLNAGASWNLFAENTAFEDSEGENPRGSSGLSFTFVFMEKPIITNLSGSFIVSGCEC